eukprot:9295802-Karenia_brevis.AAC.1
MFWQQLKHRVVERSSLKQEMEQYHQVQQSLEALAGKVQDMWMSGEKQHTHQHSTEPEPEEAPDPWQEQERELSWIEIAAYTHQWPVE